MDDLVQRLRTFADPPTWMPRDRARRMGVEAADRIVALEAELDALQAEIDGRNMGPIFDLIAERDRLRAFADAFAPLAEGVFGCVHYHDALCSRCAMFLPLKASWAMVAAADPLHTHNTPETTE